MGDLADRRIIFNILEREIVLLERDRQGGQALTRNRHGKAYVRLIIKAKMIGAYTRADQITSTKLPQSHLQIQTLESYRFSFVATIAVK